MPSASGSSTAKKRSAAGHWYRAAFALAAWIVLILAPAYAPASFVRNKGSIFIMVGVCVLTVAFTLLTIAIWLADRKRAK